MNLNSLIDTIKRSIVTGTSADVEITDKSLLSGLLGEDSGGGRPFYRSILSQWRLDINDRFPLFMTVFRTLWSFFVAVVSLVYLAAGAVMLLLTGKWKDRSTSPRMNAVIFLSVVASLIVVAIMMVAFFFRNVLMFTPDNHVNDAGTLVMKQPCGKEHYVFLFNTAECWANTGIEVMEGDRLEMSASGAFYGRVQDLDSCASANVKLPFVLNNPSIKEADAIGGGIAKYCMYGKSDSRFGSLLCQIQPDALPCVSMCNDSVNGEIIVQLDMDAQNGSFASFDVRNSGLLYVAVNDIYLSQAVKDALKKESPEVKMELFGDAGVADSVINQCKESAWFNDNLGEILINIVVLRGEPGESAIVPFGLMSRMYRSIDEWTSKDWDNLFASLGIVAALLAADFAFGRVARSRRKNNGDGSSCV